MSGVREMWGSFLGKKLIAAVTGLVLLLFLVGHMAGNLKALLGTDASGTPEIDIYGHFLRTVGEPLVPHGFVLWTARIVLLVSLVLHMVTVIQLAVANQAARPIRYTTFRTRASSLPAKTMMYTGILILAFVVAHVLHFTTGTIRVGQFEHGKVYANLFYSFGRPVVALAYIAMMLVVGTHVLHGGWSFFQTCGIDNPDRNFRLRVLAIVVTLLIVLGFSLIPFLFMTGYLPSPQDLVLAPNGTGG